MSLKLTTAVAVVILLLGLASASRADLGLGSNARQIAMGGAGLALTDDPSNDVIKNPAALAYASGFSFRWPNLEFRGRGAAGLGDVIDHISQQTDISAEDAISLARDFSSGPTTMQLNLETGIRILGVDIAMGGAGQVIVTPDPTLMGSPNSPPTGAYADIQAGALYALPSVTVAQRFKSSGGAKSTVVLGERVNILHSVSYSDRATYGGVTWSTTGASVVKDTDWSADLGLIYELTKPIGAKIALVATDVRKPSLPGLNVETVYHAGFAMTTNLGLVLVADLRNLTEAYGEPRVFCAGAEWKLGPLALRAGTSSKGSGWSTGIGIKNFGLSFSPKSAFDAATSIHF